MRNRFLNTLRMSKIPIKDIKRAVHFKLVIYLVCLHTCSQTLTVVHALKNCKLLHKNNKYHMDLRYGHSASWYHNRSYVVCQNIRNKLRILPYFGPFLTLLWIKYDMITFFGIYCVVTVYLNIFIAIFRTVIEYWASITEAYLLNNWTHNGNGSMFLS